MARLRRLATSGKVFFVTTNLRRGLPPFTPGERDLLCQALAQARDRRQFLLPGFVLMPDHLHMLVLPASRQTISAVVQEIKSVAGRTINARRAVRGTLWQKGFFDRFMRTPKEFLESLEYMHQNPVRRGLVLVSEQWRWSSATAYAGHECILSVDFLDLPAQSEKRLW